MYLYHLQTAINQVTYSRSGHPPEADEFDDIAESWSNLTRHAASLRIYYSNNLLEDKLSEKYWRLPDLRDLPIGDRNHYKHFPRSLTRLPRFAFAVVKTYMTTTLPRTWIVDQALSVFQQATVRLRSQRSDEVDMYSETQIYFWITYIHLRVSHYNADDIPSLQFQQLFSTIDFDVNAWRNHYSVQRWSSIEARVQFLQPDRMPLVPVCTSPSAAPISPALRRQAQNTGLVPEVASDEELALALAVALKLVESVASVDDLDLNVHAHALLWLFHAFVARGDVRLDTKEFDTVKRQMSKKARLSEAYIDQIASIVCEVLHEAPEKWRVLPTQIEKRNNMFRDFLIEHKQLLQESLWKVSILEDESLLENKSLLEDESLLEDDCLKTIDGKKEIESSYFDLTKSFKECKLDNEDDDGDYDDAASTAWEVL